MTRVLMLGVFAVGLTGSAAGCALNLTATCEASGGTYAGGRALGGARDSRRPRRRARRTEPCICGAQIPACSAAGDRERGLTMSFHRLRYAISLLGVALIFATPGLARAMDPDWKAVE